MKKIILFIAMLLCALSISAQDKTVLGAVRAGETYFNVQVGASDTITAALDTTDYKFKYLGDGNIMKVAVHAEFDKRTSNDTVSVQLLGYDFLDDTSANAIITATASNVTANSTDLIIFDDYQAGADEFAFKYYVVRIIRTGTGGGVKVKELELKLYNQ